MRGDEPGTDAINPLTKLAAAIAWFVVATVVFDFGFLAAMVALLIVVIALSAQMTAWTIVKAFLFFTLSGLGLLQANLFFHESAGWYTRSLSGGTAIGDEALRDGFTLFLRAIAYGAISLAFVATTSPAALVRALMQHLRLPPFLAFSVLSALQFVPSLADDLRQLRLAHAMRGGNPRRSRLTLYAGLAIPLIAGTIRRANRAAISMEARGLQRGMVRTSLRVSSITWLDGVFLIGAIVALAALYRLSRWTALVAF